MIKYKDFETDKVLIFLTNNFKLDAVEIAKLYRARWFIEIFFRWVKQHLKIKFFWEQSENAVKTQVWIAASVYVLVAIAKKQFRPLRNITGFKHLKPCKPTVSGSQS
ncbi:transposase [Arachidicoccus terrestris]|nr:transposase [Arachidicoccus terrestris]